MILYIDTDEQGNITACFKGKRVVPDRQYDYFFFVPEFGEDEDITQYKIENDQLVKKDAE